MREPDAHVTEVVGPLVRARTSVPLSLGDLIHVGEQELLGEVVALEGALVAVQMYEETAGLAPGAPVYSTGHPLTVELGPGLLGGVFDGIQRPLDALAREEGDFLRRGSKSPALDRDRLWNFEPSIGAGETVTAGVVLGRVAETGAIEHRVLVPPGVSGVLTHIEPAGPRRVDDVVARIGDLELRLFHRWDVRKARPVQKWLPLTVPLVTGQRVIDTFFPLARGGTAAMPGGFGTGKTITQQQLCKWARADIIVFVGCGERGNEMTHMLRELPELIDPRTRRLLSERTILIANTSNMPVCAREASIYTGVTIAEYFRDMGYHVALVADSTSRWAEALREISGRLGEVPSEEGFPPYLASKLASFYERAGRVTTLSGAEGSVSVISAISPPGGDLTEPVTRHSQRFVRTFWVLDKELAEARVFPAISPRDSYSETTAEIAQWWSEQVSSDWQTLRAHALAIMAEAARIEETVRLIGSESLPERERFLLRMSELFREGLLQQSAFDTEDAFCPPEKQVALLRLLLTFHDCALHALQLGITAAELGQLSVVPELERAKSSPFAEIASIALRVAEQVAGLEMKTGTPAGAAA